MAGTNSSSLYSKVDPYAPTHSLYSLFNGFDVSPAANLRLGDIPIVAMNWINAAGTEIPILGWDYGVAPSPVNPVWRQTMDDWTWKIMDPATIGPNANRGIDIWDNPYSPGVPPWYGTGPSGITGAWGGGAFDKLRGRFHFCGGGAEAGYGGNDVYLLNCRSETPNFEVHAVASSQCGQTNARPHVAVYNDNKPVAMHGYWNYCWDPGRDQFVIGMLANIWRPAGSGVPSGLDQRLWGLPANASSADEYTELCWSGLPYPQGTGECGSVYDEAEDRIWSFANPGQSVYRWTPGNSNFELMGGWGAGAMTQAAPFYIPEDDCFMLFGTFNLSPRRVRPIVGQKSGGNPATGIATFAIGDAQQLGSMPTDLRAAGHAYVPNARTFFFWNYADGANLWKCKLPDPGNLVFGNYQWDQVTPAPTNTVIPTTNAKNGVFGRLFYDEVTQTLWLHNSMNEYALAYAIDEASL